MNISSGKYINITGVKIMKDISLQDILIDQQDSVEMDDKGWSDDCEKVPTKEDLYCRLIQYLVTSTE